MMGHAEADKYLADAVTPWGEGPTAEAGLAAIMGEMGPPMRPKPKVVADG